MSEFLSRNRSWLMTLLCLVAALWVLAWWRAEGTPQPLAEGADGKLQCLSYTAFRKPDETPMNPDASVDEARVREDLSILSARTGCVRPYSVIQGLEHVPKVAKELGMQVLMGIWIGRERDKNDLEIERAIALARQYPDTIRGIVVGNEVLLRREQSAQQMATYLDRVRAAVDIPVTYADVWEFWAENKSLADHVSFVTVHILPYWEDHPVGIHDAIQHITGTAEQMRQMFHGKDVLIGETGWPSAGRQRMAAVASRVNEARFMREFSQAAADHHLNYNFIEGFDQPWKRGQEGAMGGNWGVFDSDGQPKFPATGPVAEDPHWYRGWLGAAAGALVALGHLGHLWPGLGGTGGGDGPADRTRTLRPAGRGRTGIAGRGAGAVLHHPVAPSPGAFRRARLAGRLPQLLPVRGGADGAAAGVRFPLPGLPHRAVHAAAAGPADGPSGRPASGGGCRRARAGPHLRAGCRALRADGGLCEYPVVGVRPHAAGAGGRRRRPAAVPAGDLQAVKQPSAGFW